MSPDSKEPEKDELPDAEAAADAADPAAPEPDPAAPEPEIAAEAVAEAADEAPAEEAPAPKPKRRRRKAAEAPEAEAAQDTEAAADDEEPEAAADDEEPEAADAPAPARPSSPAPTRRRSRLDPDLPIPIVRAQAKYVRSSARKARLVCDNIRGKSVDEARAILALTPRAIARDWSKLLESAIANAEHNHELVGEDLYVKAVHADEGPTIKRFRPRAMGRATRIRKRTSHLTILLTPKD
jgi:ribosomal protein L22